MPEPEVTIPRQYMATEGPRGGQSDPRRRPAEVRNRGPRQLCAAYEARWPSAGRRACGEPRQGARAAGCGA